MYIHMFDVNLCYVQYLYVMRCLAKLGVGRLQKGTARLTSPCR